MITRIEQPNQITGRYILRAVLIALIFASAGTIILAYRFVPTNTVNLKRGDVAPNDILAPHQIVYTSEFETEAARERARNSVSRVYSFPNRQVARQQDERLRKIFDYMDTVKADPYGSQAEKFEWIDAIPDLTLSDTVIDDILIMNDEAWAETRQEALAILDEAMSAEIREAQVLATRRQLPTKVALDTPETQSNVIVAIVEDLIVPNTFPDDARTEAERQAAADAVEPVVVTIEANELIISAGQRVGPKALEALAAAELEEPKFSWVDDLIAPAVLVLLTTIVISFYLIQFTPRILIDTKRLVLLVLLVLIFISIAKFMISTNPIVAYLYPIAAFAMIIAIIIDAPLAFISTTMLAFLSGYIDAGHTAGLVIYLILGGWTGILALGRGQRVSVLLRAGVYVAIVNSGLILIFNLPQDTALDTTNVALLIAEGFLNGVLLSAGLAFFGLFVIGYLFGITTFIQLSELERPTQPLLRTLLLKAPGTYHHSLMVGNLAQQAAERIGADSLLVRVMALYHDIGKMQRPYFFIENQPDGMSNVHEKLDPQVSAQIIINHVIDGLELARKYRLPQTIRDGIAQHQGTGLVRFFYYQALEAAKEKGRETIDEANFRYPGPKPQTKETGILMLADVSETTVRALKPHSAEEIDEIVRKSFTHNLESGQLDECDLTIADLRKIRRAFVEILQGIHHPRIKYPEEQVKDEEEPVQAKAEQPDEQETPQAEPSSGKQPSPARSPQPANAISSSSSRPARLVQRE